MALVGHPVVECVRPDRNTAKRRGDGGVVDKVLVGHHLELLVPSHPEVGGPDSDDRAVRHVGKALDDETRSRHLGQPVVVAALAPVLGLVAPRHAEHADLVTLPVQILEERKKRFHNE